MRNETRIAMLLAHASVFPGLIRLHSTSIAYIEEHAWIPAITAIMLVVSAVSVAGLLWLRRRSTYYHRLYAGELERTRAKDALQESGKRLERFLMKLL